MFFIVASQAEKSKQGFIVMYRQKIHLMPSKFKIKNGLKQSFDMKKFLALIITITFLISCQKEELQEDAIEQVTPSSPDPMTRAVVPSIVDWQKCFGSTADEFANAVAKGSNGYLVAGSLNTGDAYVAYYDRTSALVKTTVLGGSGSESIKGVVVTDDGGFWVVGTTTSIETPGYGGEGYNILISKFSATGDKEWVKSLGIANQQSFSAIKTSDGGLAISGYMNSHLLFIKLNPDATLDWQATYLYPGSKADVGYSLVETTDAFVVAGRTLDINNNADLLIVSINKTDKSTTGRKFGNSGNSEIGFSIALNASTSNFVVTGRKDNDLLAAKFDGQLNLISTLKMFGGTGVDIGRSVISTADGYLIVGQTDSRNGDIINSKGGMDLWVLRLDINLNKTSMGSHNFGGNREDAGYAVISDGDGFTAAGHTKSTSGDVSGNSGGSDMWLVKFNF